MAAKGWLTIREVAEVLGVDENTARRYWDMGRLNYPVPGWRLGVRRDRRTHPDSAERLRRELQEPDTIQGPDSERGASPS